MASAAPSWHWKLPKSPPHSYFLCAARLHAVSPPSDQKESELRSDGVARGFPQSVQVPGLMFGGSGGRILLEPWHFGLAALALILAIGEEKWEWFERAIRAPVPVYASALALMLFCLVIFGVLDAAIPFIYFQF